MYTHRVQYYETDKMGIVHHSNYIRWFEEARIDWMRHCGISYREMEKQGIIVPVLELKQLIARWCILMILWISK